MLLAIDIGNTNIVIGGIQDGVIAFFTAVGLASVVWVLAGAFLGAGRPMIPGLALVLPLRREALAMESDVRELRRLQRGDGGVQLRLGKYNFHK